MEGSMSKSFAFAVVLCLVGCGGGGLRHVGQQLPNILRPGLSDAGTPQDWLVQKVCADANDAPVPVDPYSSSDPFGNGCSGYTERDIRNADTVPYYRYVDTGSANLARDLYAYSYPVASASGEMLYVMVREFAALNRPPNNWYVNPVFYPGHTHWDTYRIEAG